MQLPSHSVTGGRKVSDNEKGNDNKRNRSRRGQSVEAERAGSGAILPGCDAWSRGFSPLPGEMGLDSTHVIELL